jgi:DNA-directed RNA polymerase specialized sigma subunit
MELLEERQTRGFERAGASKGLEKRILFLDPVDRKLLELTVRGTLTRREAGMLVGLSSGTVTRRVRRLLDRLHHPIVAALVDYGQLLPELHREVGLAHFLRNRSFTEIEGEYGLSRYAVTRMVQYIQGWHEASRSTGNGRSKRSRSNNL